MRAHSSIRPSARAAPLRMMPNAVRHAFGDFEDMGGEDHGATGGDALRKQRLSLCRAMAASSRSAARQGSAERIMDHAPASATFCRMPREKPSPAPMGLRFKIEPEEKFLHAPPRNGRLDLPEPADEGEIFDRRQLVIDHRLVGQPGDDAFCARGIV